MPWLGRISIPQDKILDSESPSNPAWLKDRKLPNEVVESGVEVVENVPDPATPLEDRDFFAHFNVEDIAGAFTVSLAPDSQGAGVLEGFDFLVECLGMSIGLTELGVAAIERIHRAAS